MDRYICVHGHFYQPPRENPWLEVLEVQDSAYPYHDWNERITAECYAPNAAARLLDGAGRITQITNNYARISFNFGPTLLAWLQRHAPKAYQAVLEADRESQHRFSGHGSALAQAFNHTILPLATRADKVTQVCWGIRDFEHRFGRAPEGMWLPETAVNLETLEVLADQRIKFTILAPHQARRFRKIGAKDWHDVSGGRIDPTTPYVQRLPSGKSMSLFFYDGPISRAIAFEGLLRQGEHLAHRLSGAFTDGRAWPQLVHIATDGESYGHHHRHGDMALAYALHHVEKEGLARLTNYGEYLERHAPTHEVDIIENTAWSCAHGLERWRSDCGCNSGRPGWRQCWRTPLRAAFDWLRDACAPHAEQSLRPLLRDLEAARHAYVSVLLERSPDSAARFLERHARRPLDGAERSSVLKAFELQRQLQLMYTSCGWFFDDISGLETVQIISYAGRAIQLAGELWSVDLEPGFVERLERAKSNVPEYKNGRCVYEKFVKPAVVRWDEVGAHYAVRSLFETYSEQDQVFCYAARRDDFQCLTSGKAKLVVGRAQLTSQITLESETRCFGALHLGDHNVSCGVCPFEDEAAYAQLARELSEAFAQLDFPRIIRLFDRGFGESTYSLKSLFRDEQRTLTRRILQPTLTEAEAVYRRLYLDHRPTMRFLYDTGVPLPRAFQLATEYILNTDLRWALTDDEPDVDHVRNLLEEAAHWRASLDSAGLAYRLKNTVARIAERLTAHPDDLTLLRTLSAVTELARTVPFEVDLWQPQNTYYDLLHTVFVDYEERAAKGEEAARLWLEYFLPLGDQLGVQVGDVRQKVAQLRATPTVAELVDETVARRHIPRATYRIQFNKNFTFDDARQLIPYWHDLGISDLYCSPILKARAGSMHGYDICDHGQINPELGGEAAFERFSASLRERGMGLILDAVPNHMGVGHASNAWWMDVLENGCGSIYASYFDIDWHSINPDLENKLLLPILGDQYGTVLESGHLRLGYEDGAFVFHYWDTKLPLAPRSYSFLLEHALPRLMETLGEASPAVQETHSILTALRYLPPREGLPPEKVIERNREKEVVKRRIAALAEGSAEFRQALQDTVRDYNGVPGDPRSFDLLDGLLAHQPYRPAYWRVATEEINYRRFFDINELAAIRVERPEVFQATHQLIFRLLAEGKATGLRIDHPDGLWDPAHYFRRLHEGYVTQRVRNRLGQVPEGLEREVAARLTARRAEEATARPVWPLYVVAEKILGENEPLPLDWAVAGTTGYDFLNSVNGLFVDGARQEAMDATYAQFIGTRLNFNQLVVTCQKIIMLVSMASEVNALSHQLDRISERNRRYRDFTLNSLTFAIREIIAYLFIYRTYITGPDTVSERDRRFVEQAVEDAKTQNPRTAEAIFDFVRDTLLLRNIHQFHAADRSRLVEWVMKFQQLSAPVLAKGLEDTAFYVFNRLISLNEVGGHPDRYGLSVADFHRQQAERRHNWPHSLLATSSHDTKRSEDIRARLNVLSEVPEEWRAALARWSDLNAAKKTVVEGQPAPDRNDEYLLYQTMLGVWPPGPMTGDIYGRLRERVTAYLNKATKEAKVHTSWINPNEEYDAAVRGFVGRLLADDANDPFVMDLCALQARLAFFGYFNSLGQTLLRLTSPGVPDCYQGCELWDFSLVDPDNRRPVDYARRQAILNEVRGRVDDRAEPLVSFAHALLNDMTDGRVKMYLIYLTLRFRREHQALFANGDYVALEVEGAQANHVCAFARTLGETAVVVVVPRLLVGLTGGAQVPPQGADVWRDTRIVVPPALAELRFRNLFTSVTPALGQTGDRVVLPLGDVLKDFPVALLSASAI